MKFLGVDLTIDNVVGHVNPPTLQIKSGHILVINWGNTERVASKSIDSGDIQRVTNMAKEFNSNPNLIKEWRAYRVQVAQEGLNYYPEKINEMTTKLTMCKEILKNSK